MVEADGGVWQMRAAAEERGEANSGRGRGEANGGGGGGRSEANGGCGGEGRGKRWRREG